MLSAVLPLVARYLNAGAPLRRVGESANFVFELIDSGLGEAVVVKQGQPGDLRAEADFLARLAQFNLKGVRFPQALGVTEVGDTAYLVLERLHGRAIEAEDAPTAAAALASLHARLLVREEGPLARLAATVANRAQNLWLGLPPAVSRALVRALDPSVEVLAQTPWVLNLDAHPLNFLSLLRGGLGCFDKEPKGPTPAICDLANLLIWFDDEMDTLLRAYCSVPDAVLSYDASVRAAPHAVLFRSLALLAAWSAPHRPAVRAERSWLLGRMRRALDRLEAARSEASAIRRILSEIEDHLGGQTGGVAVPVARDIAAGPLGRSSPALGLPA